MALPKRPADNLSAVQVNDCSQVVEPASKPQVGEVLSPDVVRVAGDKPVTTTYGFEQIGWSWFSTTACFDILLPSGRRRYAVSTHDPPGTVLANAQVRGDAAMAVVFVLGNDYSYLCCQLTVMSGTNTPLVLAAAVKAEEGAELGFKAFVRLCNQRYFFEREASAVSLPSKP